ncbi:hypothetical protein BGW80DRAFT_1413041 [Lactifluus volemus]|nr:hypothetical protein BGW80DRAFT_1413041 [Lactifluus volemus]
MSEIIDIEHGCRSEITDIEHARLAETERFFRHYYPLFYIATPPIYAGISLLRKGRGHLTVNRLLRATWLGGAAGIVGGGAIEYIRSKELDS